jgi:hypothetical protein
MTIQAEQSVRSVPFNPPTRPLAYYIPASLVEVIEVQGIHGIELEVVQEDLTLEAVNYRMNDFAIGSSNREGRARAGGTPVLELSTRTCKMNDVKVLTDQPLGTLAVSLLEPSGEDSFFYRGYFNGHFSQAEYGENYIMVPIAEEMLLAEYPAEIDAWELYKSENPDYAEDASGVIDSFFSKTAPFHRLLPHTTWTPVPLVIACAQVHLLILSLPFTIISRQIQSHKARDPT